MTLSRFDQEFFYICYAYFITAVFVYNSFMSLELLMVFTFIHHYLRKKKLGKFNFNETNIIKIQFILSLWFMVQLFFFFLLYHLGDLQVLDKSELSQFFFKVAECSKDAPTFGPETFNQSLKVAVWLAVPTLIANYGLVKLGCNPLYNLQIAYKDQIQETVNTMSELRDQQLINNELELKNKSLELLLAKYQLKFDVLPQILSQVSTQDSVFLSGGIGFAMGLAGHNYLTNNKYRRLVYHANPSLIKYWSSLKVPLSSHDLIDKAVIYSRHNLKVKHFVLPLYGLGMLANNMLSLETLLKLIKF